MRLFSTHFSDKMLLLDTEKLREWDYIKEILRTIWLITANKIKPSEYICKQSSQTQAIIVTNNRHTKASSRFKMKRQQKFR